MKWVVVIGLEAAGPVVGLEPEFVRTSGVQLGFVVAVGFDWWPQVLGANWRGPWG